MKTAFFQGSFDIINAGHIRSFALVKKEADMLVIGLNTDEIIRQDKGREPIIPYAQRREILEAIRFVDLVVPCDNIYAIRYVQQLDADIFVTVQEWKVRQEEAIQWVTAKGGSVFVPPYFPHDGVTLSSTQIRQRIIEGGK